MTSASDHSSLIESLVEQIGELSRQQSALRAEVAEVRSLVGPFGLNLGDLTLVHTIHKTHYLVPSSDTLMLPNLVIYRNWESSVSALLFDRLKPISTFIDIGANFGYFACLAKRIVSSIEGRVFAVEPNPQLAGLIEINASINWGGCSVTVFNCAVSDVAGTATLVVPRTRSGNAFIRGPRDVPPGVASQVEVDEIEVDARRLDELAMPLTDHVMVKLDVEGYEPHVLPQVAALLDRCRAWDLVMEWSPTQLGAEGARAVIRVLGDLGESVRLIEAGVSVPIHDLLSVEYGNLHLASAPTFG